MNCYYNFTQQLNMPPQNVNPTIPQITYSGIQLLTLYNIPIIKNTNKQVSIAIIIAFHHPNLLSDLKTYWQSPLNFGSDAIPPNVNVYSFGSKVNSGWLIMQSFLILLNVFVHHQVIIIMCHGL